MAKGEIQIIPELCRGCALCTNFCPRGCISIPGDRFTPTGYLLAVFSEPDECTACGICGNLCPELAIEVYKYVKDKSPVAG